MGRPRSLQSRSPARALSYGRVVDAAARDGELRVFVVAGEVSGDSLASRLMASLRALSPIPVRFSGVGGELMSREGLLTLFPIEEIAIMGLWERLPHIYSVKKKIEDTVNAAMVFQPHAVVTIDSKGFSFRLFRQLKCKGINEVFFFIYSRAHMVNCYSCLGRCNQKIQRPLYVHYVAPSFWAWKGSESRLSKLHDFVDHVLCILPFEEEICKLIALPATYVGHPLLDDAIGLNMRPRLPSDKSKHQRSSEAFRLEHGLHLGKLCSSRAQPGLRVASHIRCFPVCTPGIL
ncbi:probable lipid-A-disaccharide synthase, mitochondrial isoform X2 [Phragmites australis]|uniref:probable lipid-A-disaccharide synthase, mitochondrial isoform X2 n=1 Tax=Phragmites australis TaxID=29695 RepID=UPI002D772A3C|nr:probable lipid-A-disaccharide synthase, mitochondrial isoform X2 [Phragmites australis]